MPRDSYQLAAPGEAPAWFSRWATSLNRILGSIASSLAGFEGLDGKTPTFQSDVSIGGNRLRNVGKASLDTDGVQRGELMDDLFSKTIAPGKNTATLTNAPIVGDPTTYLVVEVKGVAHIIPAWRIQ